MRFTDDQKKMLDGVYGKGVQHAMQLLVAIGETFDAERMIPISRAHVSLSVQEGDTYWCELLANGGAKCKIAPTTNPAWDIRELQRFYNMDEKDRELLERTINAYRRIGAKLTLSCTPQMAGNVASFGEHVSFSESSVVTYANSILGARTNLESSCSSLASAVTGFTPLFGFHIEENRYGTVLIDVETELEEAFDWGILGFYIGKLVGSRVPVLKFRNLKKKPRPEELLFLGTEMAVSGSVAMYHVVGVTPEAPTVEAAFGGKKPQLTIPVQKTHLVETEEKISEKDGKISSVFLGCPHYSYEQIREVASLLDGKKIHKNVDFWVLTDFYTIELAKRGGELEIIEKAGARLLPDTCSDQPCWKSFEGTLGITDSPKCMYYRSRRGQPFIIKRLADCIKAAIKGEV